MNKEELLRRMESFPYDSREYWLVAGAAMVLYGLREECRDIDMGCSRALADRLEKEGFLYRRTEDGMRWLKWGKDIELFENWLYDKVVVREGLPVISLPGLLQMKERLGRQKDLQDAALIRNCMKAGDSQYGSP